MKVNRVVFVYLSDNKYEKRYRVLTYDKAIRLEHLLLKAGYKHVMTLDAVHWIQNKLNENTNTNTKKTP
jgi:hypothetical protein